MSAVATGHTARNPWLRPLAIAGFALLFAWDTWEALQNLLLLPAFAAQLGLTSAQVPWWLLISNLALPPVLFAVALVVGRRRRLTHQVLILLVALAVVAAWSLLLAALAPLALASQL